MQIGEVIPTKIKLKNLITNNIVTMLNNTNRYIDLIIGEELEREIEFRDMLIEELDRRKQNE